jgi:hypothetical protein
MARMAARRPRGAWPSGAAALFLCLALIARVQAADDPLARARQLYNQRQFQAAIEAAEVARLTPSRTDAADLVAARAYLERYRDTVAAEDLASARERLARISPERFSPHERFEYIIGLGEALYFDDAFGAAATVFGSVLQSTDLLGGAEREQVLDWWATALDRDTRPRPEIERQAVYQRMRERLQSELAEHPSSGAAIYWVAAVARAQGDLQGAWDAAQAGWVRAPLSPDRGAALRADLDRLMERAIVPERARALAQPPDAIRTEWNQFKARWSK